MRESIVRFPLYLSPLFSCLHVLFLYFDFRSHTFSRSYPSTPIPIKESTNTQFVEA